MFDEDKCAAFEVEYYSGSEALQAVQGMRVGRWPVLASNLIEFPDNELERQVEDAYNQVWDQLVSASGAYTRELWLYWCAHAVPHVPTRAAVWASDGHHNAALHALLCCTMNAGSATPLANDGAAAWSSSGH
jgi:hypothetical protein